MLLCYRRSLRLLQWNYDILAMPKNSRRNLIDNPSYKSLGNFSTRHCFLHRIR